MTILSFRRACAVSGLVLMVAALGPAFAASSMLDHYVPEATDRLIVVDCFRALGALSIAFAALLLGLWRVETTPATQRVLSRVVLLGMAVCLVAHLLSALLTGPGADVPGATWSSAVYGEVAFWSVGTIYWLLVCLSGESSPRVRDASHDR